MSVIYMYCWRRIKQAPGNQPANQSNRILPILLKPPAPPACPVPEETSPEMCANGTSVPYDFTTCICCVISIPPLDPFSNLLPLALCPSWGFHGWATPGGSLDLWFPNGFGQSEVVMGDQRMRSGCSLPSSCPTGPPTHCKFLHQRAGSPLHTAPPSLASPCPFRPGDHKTPDCFASPRVLHHLCWFSEPRVSQSFFSLSAS